MEVNVHTSKDAPLRDLEEPFNHLILSCCYYCPRAADEKIQAQGKFRKDK